MIKLQRLFNATTAATFAPAPACLNGFKLVAGGLEHRLCLFKLGFKRVAFAFKRGPLFAFLHQFGFCFSQVVLGFT